MIHGKHTYHGRMVRSIAASLLLLPAGLLFARRPAARPHLLRHERDPPEHEVEQQDRVHGKHSSLLRHSGGDDRQRRPRRPKDPQRQQHELIDVVPPSLRPRGRRGGQGRRDASSSNKAGRNGMWGFGVDAHQAKDGCECQRTQAIPQERHALKEDDLPTLRRRRK